MKKYALIALPFAFTGCALLREVGDAAQEQFAETGGAVVDAIEDAAGGDPVAIISAAVAALGFAGAVVGRIIIKRRRAAK